MANSEIEVIVEQLRANPLGGTLEEMRAQFDDMGAEVAADVDIKAVTANGIPCELHTPPGADTSRVIMYVHGGGYVIGSLKSHRATVAELARAGGCRALAVDYRLAPENPYPAAVEDSVAAYNWLCSSGYEPGKIVIAGDSAGGGLTAGTLVALRDASQPLPAAGVCISPWVDLEATGESYESRKDIDPMVTRELIAPMGNAYVGEGGDLKATTACPIHADLTGLPPLLIQVGSAEVLFSDAETLAKNAEAAGVEATLEEWPDMVHVWHLFHQNLEDGRKAITRIGEFVKEKTGA
ncbi:MAG: alpha/beta hydrolase [Gammaproteobacteria bacterium]|nr:MAG: alpha/beta hydrolase [Gammaproteobacteria bacterium]